MGARPFELDAVFAAGGEVGAIMGATDWSQTPLGAVAGWPQSLRTAVSIVLASRHPLIVWWGPDLVMLYNDALAPSFGENHLAAVGRPGREVFPEMWPVIGPMLEGVLATGEATWRTDQPLPMVRHGFVEDTYWTYSYSPIRDESGAVGGVFTATSETTSRVLGERRLRLLREVADRVVDAHTAERVCELAAEVLARAPGDVPFSLIFLVDAAGRWATLAGAGGIAVGDAPSPLRLDVPETDCGWPLAEALRAGALLTVHAMAASGLAGALPRTATIVPVARVGHGLPRALIVVGHPARVAVDDGYEQFLEQLGTRLSRGIADAEAFEAERRRAEELLELDRVKTSFFTSISHEFRTPLSLMLGPLQDALDTAGGSDQVLGGEELALVLRNSQRLLKLVNALLDFSRIGAGRMRGEFEPVDLARLTAELAGMFSYVAQRGGVELVVDCKPLRAPVFVDRDLWEKVVMNLLSNAFKYTLEGRISVVLRSAGEVAELSVSDTGCGIAAAELPRLFDRFHRVGGLQARSHEGSGIGLALVRELLELHGGDVDVHSAPGEGTRFVVRVPFGAAHLPADQVHAVPRPDCGSQVGASFVAEAMGWMSAQEPGERAALEAPASIGVVSGVPRVRARILLAEDNNDLRAYLSRLLAARWDVEAAASGEAALHAARERPPDLVITDAMMPGLDGFALVRELRANPGTREIPIVMLSAGAREEAAIAALEAGADDYLVKPLSGRELLARVHANLQLTELRNEAAKDLRREHRRLAQLVEQMPAGVMLAEAPSGRVVLTNDRVREILGNPPSDTAGVADYGAYQGFALDGLPLNAGDWPLTRSLRDGEIVRDEDMLYATPDGRRIVVRVNSAPIHDEDGVMLAAVVVFQDVTDRVSAQQTLEGQHVVLELIARGGELHEALEVLARTGEQQSSNGAMVSILLASADGLTLHHGVAPSLPAAYSDAIEGIIIGPGVGSCGTAAHRRETVIVTDIASDPLWADFRELGLGHGLRACWSIPILSARGDPLGTFAVYHREPHHPSPGERRTIELLARTAGIAIARDRQDRALRSQVRTLQRSLLPDSLPDIPGIQLAASYHPSHAEQVGGDFYDIVEVAGGWIAFIGDVCGKGVQAAALTSLARHTLRAAARIDPTPSRMLHFLNKTLLADSSDTFCTVLVARLALHPAGLQATIALGGHPQPLLLTAGERPRPVGTLGTLIGMIPEIHVCDFDLDITRDQALLLYTDGATDARTGARRLEEAGLLKTVAEAHDLEPSRVLATIERTLLSPEVVLADDVALLCIRPS